MNAITTYLIISMERKGLSTSTAIFNYVQFLFDSYDKAKSSNSLNWFRNYLRERTQMVRVNNHLSGIEQVNMGVPKGPF